MTRQTKKRIKKISNNNIPADNSANLKSRQIEIVNTPVEMIRRYFEDLLQWALADRENVTFTRFRILRDIDDSTHNRWVEKYPWAKEFQEKTNEVFAENMAYCWRKRIFDRGYCEKIIHEFDSRWIKTNEYHDGRDVTKAIAIAKAREQQPSEVKIIIDKLTE